MKKRKCTTCGAQFFNNYLYCPICGQKTLQWGDGNMIYEKLETNENGKLKECPKCKNEETNIEGSYCQICGELLTNYCSNEDCDYQEILPSNARYCPVCGSASTFYQNNILKPWNYKEPVPDPFWNIPDPIDEELPFS